MILQKQIQPLRSVDDNFSNIFSSSQLNHKLIMKDEILEGNAFTKAPVFTQIIAYMIVVGQFLIFTLCMYPNFANIVTRNGLAITFYLTFFISTVSWIITSIINPYDPLLRRSTKIYDKNIASNSLLYCDKCKCAVQQTSVHCLKCDACVQGLDHHCIWINHCIGKRNYRFFLVMVGFVNFNFITFLASVIQLWLEANYNIFYVAMVVAWSYSIIITIFTILLTVLMVFHIFLIAKDTTTFLFMSKNRVQKQNQVMELAEEISKRYQSKLQEGKKATSNRKLISQSKNDFIQKGSKEQLFFQINKKIQLQESIHDLKISKSRSALSNIIRQNQINQVKGQDKILE